MRADAAPGERCEECRETGREEYARKEFGECIKCRRPAELGKSFCGRHLKYKRDESRRRQAEKRKARVEGPDSRAAILQVLGRGDATLEGLAQEAGLSTRTVLRWIRKLPEIAVVESTETRSKVYRYEKPRLQTV